MQIFCMSVFYYGMLEMSTAGAIDKSAMCRDRILFRQEDRLQNGSSRGHNFPGTLKNEYQHGRYVSIDTSDIGKSARTCRQRRTDERCGPGSAQSDTFCP